MNISQTLSLKQPERIFINGEWVKASGTSAIDVVNSGTEEVFARIAEAQEDDINHAVASTCTAFDKGPLATHVLAHRFPDHFWRLQAVGHWSGRWNGGFTPFLEAKTVVLDDKPSHWN